MEILLILAVLILAFYVYKNTKVSNYFFSIFFHWSKVYELLNIPEEEFRTFNIGEDYKKLISNNVNDGSPLVYSSLIMSEVYYTDLACFEYYVIPRTWKGYYSWGHIFDQQNKTFFESPNTAYRGVLKGGKNGESFISCGLQKGALSSKVASERKACFWINYSKETSAIQSEQKTLAIIFNEEYLNMGRAHSFKDKIPCDIYLINHQDSEVKKIEIKNGDFHVGIDVQSQQDAQSNPVISELYEYFKKNKVKSN